MRLFLVCKFSTFEHTLELYPDSEHPEALAVIRNGDLAFPECAPHRWVRADTPEEAREKYLNPKPSLEDVLLR